MILDTLYNADLYLGINPGLAAGFEFLRRTDLAELSSGRHEIDGDEVFALVVREKGKPASEALLESHLNYLDIQYVIEGRDQLGWKTTSTCVEPTAPYDPDTDLQFFRDAPNTWLATGPGSYAIFLPDDAHMPLISDGDLHKVVIKIAVNQ